MTVTVSAALIVRNEERTLGCCLESIYGLVDEIVVVDTGSDDSTVEVARRYTDRVFTFPWIQDFAAARQFAFDHATSDWVFWLDADDVVRNAAQIRPTLQDIPSSVGLVYWRYEVARDAHGNVTCAYWRERACRGGLGTWVGRIHETLQAPGGVHYAPEVVVEHHPEPNRPTLQRNIAIMESVRAAEGDSPRLLFYLGRDYAQLGEADKALQTLHRYLEIAVWDDERYQAINLIADIHRARQEWNEAIDANLAALKVHPTWPDAYFGLARTYYFLQDWPKVVHWSEIGEMLAEPETLAITNPLDYRFTWIIYYTNALYHTGRVADALHWTRQALEIVPDDRWHQENERLFAAALGAAEPAGGQ